MIFKFVKLVFLLAGLCAMFALGWLTGVRAIGDPIPAASLPAAERAFAARMRNVTMAGTFTISGREDRTPDTDRYEIASVEKVGDDLWRFNAKMDCCGAAGKSSIPIVVPMRFAGDTPVIMFGRRSEVDPVRFVIGAAMAWGGNPEREATYLNVTPTRNDGRTVHTLTVKNVPVDGFWSISVYNARGYFEPNTLNAYTLNNLTARREPDGSIAVRFGGCEGSASNGASNCLPITPGWNYLVRLYRPRAEILDGSWTFPEAQPVS